MDFESMIKMHFPHLAAIIYDDNLPLKDFHPSFADDFSYVQNVHRKSFQINLDRSHLPSMINSTPNFCHKNLITKISNTNSDHIQNLNIAPYQFDMQSHTHNISSKDTFTSIAPSPCTEAFEVYLQRISNNQDLFDMTNSTSPTIDPKDVPNILHVPHDNTMWENDQNRGLIFGIESTFNLAMVESNLYVTSRPMGVLNAREDIIINRRQNNQIVIKTDQIKKNRRFQMRRGCKPMKKASVIKGQWTSEEDR